MSTRSYDWRHFFFVMARNEISRLYYGTSFVILPFCLYEEPKATKQSLWRVSDCHAPRSPI